MTITSGEGWDLGRALEALTELLVAEEPLKAVLDRVVVLAQSSIAGCDFASITAAADAMFETVASSDPIALQIDEAQYASDRGPCLFAFRRREIASIPSMRDGDTWVDFRQAASARGVQSSLSLPMATGAVRVGALNLYGTSDNAFDSVPSDAALLFAKQAAAAIWSARAMESTRDVIKHLERALENRELIGMAKGVIMVNEKLTPDDAFGVLVRASQDRNVKLRDLAAEVTESGVTP